MFAVSSAIGARLLVMAVDRGDAFLAGLALKVLSNTSVADRPAIQEILSKATTSVTNLQVVARVLAEYGELEALDGLLQHESGDVRLHVGRLFAEFGDTADIEKLGRTLAVESDPYITAQVQRSLAKYRSHGAATPVRRPLDSVGEQDRFVIRLLCDPVVTWRDAPALADLLQHQSPTTRTIARQELAKLGRPGAVAIAAALDLNADGDSLADTWKLLFELDQAIALQRLRARVHRGLPLPQCVVDELVRIGDGGAVAMLAGSLALQAPGEQGWLRRAIVELKRVALEPLCIAFREHGRLREHEAELLATVGGTLVIDQLVCGLRDSTSADMQKSYVQALRRFGRGAAQPLISAYLHGDGAARLALIPALANAGAPETWALLRRAATEPGDTQAPAITALGADNDPLSKQIVSAATRSPDPLQRAATIEAVSNWGAAEALIPLRSLALDSSPEVMKSTFRAFERIAGWGGDNASVVTRTLLQLYPVAESQELLDALPMALEAFGDLDTLAEAGEGFVGNSPVKVQIEAIVATKRMARSQQEAQQQHQQQQSQERDDPNGRPPAGSRLVGRMSEDPTAEAEAPSEIITDEVQFSVTAPSVVARGSEFLLDVWAHVIKDRDVVLRLAQNQLGTKRVYRRSAGPYPVARGTPLRMLVSIPSLDFADEDALYWSGTVSNTSCLVPVREQARAGLHSGTIQLFVGPLRIARVHFSVLVGDFSTDAEDRTLFQDKVRTAFASYATEDRERVLARIQGMQKLVPTLDIFLDAISLRSGDDWMQRIEEEIKTRDVLYLFWSEFAMRSQWVDREWRIALEEKGLEFIDPVPLDSPRSAPPPVELSSLHFYEWTLELRPN